MHKQQGWPQAWEYCQAKPIQTLERASQGVNWRWSKCIKSHHDHSSSGKGLPSHFWNRTITRSILPGLRRKRTGLLCYGDADVLFQQDLAPAHTAKGTKSWFNDHGVTVLDWPANLPDLNPIENLWGIVKRKMRDIRPNNADDLKAAIKATWASITPEQCHRLIASMPRRIDAGIHAKGGPTKYWVHRNEHTFQKPDISVYIFFLLILCNIQIFWDTELWVFIICEP